METKNMIVLTVALLLAGGTTMFGMSGESVKGTETKTECRAQGGKLCGDANKDCGEGQRMYRNRKCRGEGCGDSQRMYRNRKCRGEGCGDSQRMYRKGEGRGESFGHHGRKDNDARRGGYRRGEHQSSKGKMNRGQMMGKMLNLTEEQQAQVKALKMKDREQMQAMMRSMGDTKKALHEAASADIVDEAKIRELSKVMADKITESIIARAKAMKEFKALLTEEQQAKLVAKKAEFEKRMEARKNKRAAVRAKNIKKATE